MFKATIFAFCSFSLSLAQAGSISFTITFKGNEIAMVNTGSDAAYQLSAWTLNSSTQWQAVPIVSGNPAFIAPGESINGRRSSPAPSNSLEQADPLMVVFHDQSGGRMAQVAWRQSPPNATNTYLTKRLGDQLQVNPDKSGANLVAASYALVLPYDGIRALATPLNENAAPPNPQRHSWAGGAPLMLNTGAGQAGVWLVHEGVSGALQVQIVPDGKVRGQEQVPAWLAWMRRNLTAWAVALAGLGAAAMVAGRVRSITHKKLTRAR